MLDENMRSKPAAAAGSLARPASRRLGWRVGLGVLLALWLVALRLGVGLGVLPALRLPVLRLPA